MKFSLILPLAWVLTLTSLVTPVAAGEWKCNGSWGDGALMRHSFTFTGYCEERWGQCFLDGLRSNGLIIHNWQCWKRDDGRWQVDFSTTRLLGSAAAYAIYTVSGSWPQCWDGK